MTTLKDFGFELDIEAPPRTTVNDGVEAWNGSE